jgi:hypothetical protein
MILAYIIALPFLWHSYVISTASGSVREAYNVRQLGGTIGLLLPFKVFERIILL